MNTDTLSGQLLSVLHIAGGTFPTGSFSQSWGLETYIHQERIKTEKEFRDFLGFYIDDVLGGMEGPFLCEAYERAKRGELDSLPELEEELNAMRLTKESRESAFRTGKAMMRIMADITEEDDIKDYYVKRKGKGISFPIAFAISAAKLGIGKEEALMAFLFSGVNGLVQSALKLMPFGNSQAQKVILEAHERIEAAKEKALITPVEEAFAFCPGLDIASMQHENLPTRLYMS